MLLTLSLAAAMFSANAQDETEAKAYTITDAEFKFVPDTISIVPGDTVIFDLGSSHLAVGVSEETWEANMASPDSIFRTGLGGDTIYTDDWTPGTYYYVCPPHVSSFQMKGVIIVEAPTGIFSKNVALETTNSYPNPFTEKFTIETKGADVIAVSNATGVEQFSVRTSGAKAELDGSSLNSGVYYCTLKKNGTVIATRKIVKQ